MSTTRVLHLIGHLGYGGTERQLLLTLRSLPPHFRHRVAVFNPSDNGVYNRDLEDIGVEVVALAPGSKTTRVIALTREMRTFLPDVVHSWTVHDNAYAAVCGRLAGVPRRLGSLRGTMHSAGLRSLPRLYAYLCFHGVDGLVVNSQDLVRELGEAGVAANRIHHVPNVVVPPDEDLVAADLSELGCAPEHFVIGVVANLRRIKNHELFLHAFARASEQRPELRAVLVGQPVASEPDHEEVLHAIARQLGIEQRVVFAGFRGDVPRLLPAFDAVALSSHAEGMPNALLEAMAVGRPVVATAVGGISELITSEVNGLLCAPGDEATMAKAFVRLASDRALAQRLGRAAREHITSEHDGETAGRLLADLYAGEPAVGRKAA